MRMHLLYAVHQGMVATIPVACAVVAFATHAALGWSFDLHTVLMVIGCIEQMASAMMVMPSAIMFATMISISFSRFGRVLLLEDTFASPSGTGGTQSHHHHERELSVACGRPTTEPGRCLPDRGQCSWSSSAVWPLARALSLLGFSGLFAV